MSRSSRPSSDRNQTFTIRRLTKEFGVTSRAIRFYETKGLLSPTRRGSTRIFSRRDRARLQLIIRGKRVGFPLVEIKHMLDLYDGPDGEAVQRRVALTKCRHQARVLREQRDHIDAALTELTEICDALQREAAGNSLAD